jgi:hypothetical protein
MSATDIISAALNARTVNDARRLNELIATDIGAELYRPVGDKVNNFGLMTTSGSYDFKLIENVTNMQDALWSAPLENASVTFQLFRTPHRTKRLRACSPGVGRRRSRVRQLLTSTKPTNQRVRANA